MLATTSTTTKIHVSHTLPHACTTHRQYGSIVVGSDVGHLHGMRKYGERISYVALRTQTRDVYTAVHVHADAVYEVDAVGASWLATMHQLKAEALYRDNSDSDNDDDDNSSSLVRRLLAKHAAGIMTRPPPVRPLALMPTGETRCKPVWHLQMCRHGGKAPHAGLKWLRLDMQWRVLWDNLDAARGSWKARTWYYHILHAWQLAYDSTVNVFDVLPCMDHFMLVPNQCLYIALDTATHDVYVTWAGWTAATQRDGSVYAAHVQATLSLEKHHFVYGARLLEFLGECVRGKKAVTATSRDASEWRLVLTHPRAPPP